MLFLTLKVNIETIRIHIDIINDGTGNGFNAFLSEYEIIIVAVAGIPAVYKRTICVVIFEVVAFDRADSDFAQILYYIIYVFIRCVDLQAYLVISYDQCLRHNPVGICLGDVIIFVV